VPDESLPRGVSCHLTVTTDEGAQIEVQVDHPLGSIENPMSAADLRRKFDMLTQPVVGTARSAQLADALGSIETRSGIDDVLAMTVAETPRTGAQH
jgi:2-methylcitrate dehydratase PrpD